MNVSFAPLEKDAILLLTTATHVDFSYGSFRLPNWFCATARNDEGDIMGVVAAEFTNRFNATFNTVVVDRRCMSRRILRAIFTALFSKAVRITAEIATSNRAALRNMCRLGFVYEGYCRLGINGVEDAFVYGMLKEDCPFLPGYAGGTTTTMEMPDGLRTESARPV